MASSKNYTEGGLGETRDYNDGTPTALGKPRRVRSKFIGRISLFCNFSLTPGFSPVTRVAQAQAVSTAWPMPAAIRRRKRLKPLAATPPAATRLKSGVNEKKNAPARNGDAPKPLARQKQARQDFAPRIQFQP
jgi:hypothetical protein